MLQWITMIHVIVMACRFQQHRCYQVTTADLHVVLFIDCTKMGVLSQLEINAIGLMCEKILGPNPARFLVYAIIHAGSD